MYDPSVSPEGSVFISPPEINAEVRDQIYTLMCLAQGGPGNVFRWEKISGSGIFADTPTLNITVTNASFGGVYQCTVENMAGNDSSNATVNGKTYILQSLLHLFIPKYSTCSQLCSYS